MLLAEIYGKSLQAARDDEDYLTSAVFGHLRYVPPQVFWEVLFGRAKGLPDSGGREPTLSRVLADRGHSPARYATLCIHFWRRYAGQREPDLLLVFADGDVPPLLVLVEAKLWGKKTGTGKDDQLASYLQALGCPAPFGLAVPPATDRYLVYLTPRESLMEIEESAAGPLVSAEGRGRLFRLRWQDVLVAADASWAASPEPTRTILSDVARFLGRLGLQYFDGFGEVEGLPFIDPICEGRWVR